MTSLQKLMLEARSAFAANEWVRCIDRCRAALSSTDLTGEHLGELERTLATALSLQPSPSADDLVHASQIFERLLARELAVADGASIHMSLGNIHGDLWRRDVNEYENARAALRHYEAAMQHERPDPELSASIAAEAGYAAVRASRDPALSPAARGAVYDVAKRHLVSALDVFTVAAYPVEHSEVATVLASLKPIDVSAPLLCFAAKGDLENVACALRDGADPNTTDEQGITALQMAVSEGHLTTAQLLAANGADMTLRDRDGSTLLHWAVLADQPRQLAFSLVPGFGIDPVDHVRRTPLSWAASLGMLESVTWLLAQHADVNAPDADGWTPLHYAAAGGELDVVDRLLAAGADPGLRDTEGDTPLNVAESLDRAALEQVIRRLTT